MHAPRSQFLLPRTVLKNYNKQFLGMKPIDPMPDEKLTQVPHSSYEKGQHAT